MFHMLQHAAHDGFSFLEAHNIAVALERCSLIPKIFTAAPNHHQAVQCQLVAVLTHVLSVLLLPLEIFRCGFVQPLRVDDAHVSAIGSW